MPTELSTGEATTDPPLAALYQVIPVVELKAVLALRVCIGLAWHWVMLVTLAAGTTGAAVMVKVTGVRVKLEQVPLEYSA